MAMRLPVVSSRRCVQRTAFGAADVPDVNSSAHKASTLTVSHTGAARWCRRRARPRLYRGPDRATRPSPGGSFAVDEALGDENATGQVCSLDGRVEQRLVAGLGDEELHVGVRDVAGQVFATSGVVQPDHGRPRQSRAAEGEDVVRCVVKEHADVGRTTRVEAGAVQGGESLRFGEKLLVRPDPVSEAESGTIAL